MKKEEFIKEYNQFIGFASALCEKSRREGLLSLEENLDDIDDTFFKRGLRLAIDGTSPVFIEKILTNLIEQEKDEYERTLKIIKKEAIISLQSGLNIRLFLNLLNSYTDIPFDDDDFLDGSDESEAEYEHEEGKYDGEV